MPGPGAMPAREGSDRSDQDETMRFRFGLFELDEQARELRRAGTPVRIQPKPFELLCLLLRERDRVVPFDELMAALWPEEVVSPASLNRAVTHARRAVDDLGRGRLVRSVPRHGYRFGGEVSEAVSEEGDRSAAHAGSAQAGGGDAAGGDEAGGTEPSTSASRSRIFVGRQGLLERLDGLRAAVRAGGSGVALVVGRAGVGKSRLVEELGRRAERDGLRVLTGHARDEEGVPAFWLWIQILRSLVDHADHRDEILSRVASGELSPLSAVLRAFAPEVARELSASPGPAPDLSDEQQRFRFFDAAQRALAACARRQPLMVVVEDLQWADSGSLRLLEHVALELGGAPLLLVITLRDEPRERGHRVNRTVNLLRDQVDCEPIEVGGLSRGEVGRLLRAATGQPVPVDLVSELYARTEGVPLFVGEAIRLLAARGDLARPDRIPRDGAVLPARAVGLIRRTIEGLGPDCLELLEAAAVWGREFTLPGAAAVAGRARDEALDALDEAIRAGVVEAASGETATYRFAHALFREAVYEQTNIGTRARLHRAAARRLEQQHGEAPQPVLSELAHHHHRAIAVGDPERAFEIALRAAEQAREILAWEQAAIHLEQARTALEHFEAVDPRLRVDTLLALGEAHRLSGQRDRREAVFEEAVEVARGLGDSRILARAAIGLCDVSEWSARTHPRAEALLREALDRCASEDLVARARLTTRLGYLAVRDRSQSESYGRDAAALARQSGDPDALQESLYILHYILAGPDDLAEREKLVRDLTREARACLNREAAVIALLDIACDGIMQGDLEKSLRHRTLAAEVAGAQPSPSMVWHLRVWDTGRALMEGRFAEAEQGAQDAVLLGRRLGHPYAGPCFSGQACVLDRDLGRESRIVERLDGRLGSPVGATTWASAVFARAQAAEGDPEAARCMLDALLGDGPERLPRNIRWNGTIVELAMLAAEVGADPLATAMLPVLATARAQHGVLPIPIAYGGPITRCMAALSARIGLADDAIGLYEEALASAEALGARPMVARIGLELAPLCVRAGDVARGRTLLRESESLARELGMARVAADARAAAAR